MFERAEEAAVRYSMNPQKSEKVFQVSEITLEIRDLLEENFGTIWVDGEISNFRAPSSGHFYFSLKDKSSQIRGVMFRSSNARLKFVPEDGMQVLCRGRVSLYQPRGDLQLIFDTMEPSGVGALGLAFEQLKARLEAEGLFDAGLKKPLALLPETIGIVTSPTGAAIRDIFDVLDRRMGNLHLIVAPVRVQGEGAAAEIAEAIEDLNRLGTPDTIIVTRGGGSMEDLWAFNEEVVARAIHASAIPVLSAVGHEIDYTIADFVADVRAPTPSAAAEIVTLSRKVVEDNLGTIGQRLKISMARVLATSRQEVALLEGRISDPMRDVMEQRQRLDEISGRMGRSAGRILNQKRLALASEGGRLDTLNPAAVLRRGYSMAWRMPEQVVVKDAGQVASGDEVAVKLHRGSLRCLVKESFDE